MGISVVMNILGHCLRMQTRSLRAILLPRKSAGVFGTLPDTVAHYSHNASDRDFKTSFLSRVL